MSYDLIPDLNEQYIANMNRVIVVFTSLTTVTIKSDHQYFTHYIINY